MTDPYVWIDPFEEIERARQVEVAARKVANMQACRRLEASRRYRRPSILNRLGDALGDWLGCVG